jgi:hypothetical protein
VLEQSGSDLLGLFEKLFEHCVFGYLGYSPSATSHSLQHFSPSSARQAASALPEFPSLLDLVNVT